MSPFYGDPSAEIESSRKKVRAVALGLLADNPEQADRDTFLKFLPVEIDDIWHAVAALRGLATVGRAEDRQKLMRLFTDPMPSIQAAAALAYLALSPSTVVGAKDLLAEPSEYLVWVLIRHALQTKESLWTLLKALLAHENENIRRLVCYYGVRVLTKPAMRKLLEEYLLRGRYFYNVVTLLDRALYSPKPMRDMYAREDEEFFERWTASATWHWKIE